MARVSNPELGLPQFIPELDTNQKNPARLESRPDWYCGNSRSGARVGIGIIENIVIIWNEKVFQDLNMYKRSYYIVNGSTIYIWAFILTKSDCSHSYILLRYVSMWFIGCLNLKEDIPT